VSDDIFDRALDRRDAVIQEQRLRIKALEEAIREAMRRLNEYADMTVDEWDDSVADGGIMAWMVIRQELGTVVVYRLDRALLKEDAQ
jgi:hypothetical protein